MEIRHEVSLKHRGHLFQFRFSSSKELLPIVMDMANSTDVLEFDHSCVKPVMAKARELEQAAGKAV